MSNKDIETNINENTEKSETPKKKNIVHVFRPQNTQNGGNKGRRSGGNRQNSGQGKQMQANNGRPAKRPAAQNAATGEAQAPKRTERPAAEKHRADVRKETKDRTEMKEQKDQTETTTEITAAATDAAAEETDVVIVRKKEADRDFRRTATVRRMAVPTEIRETAITDMTTTVVMTDRDANSEKNQITEEMTEEITQAFRLLQSKDRNHRERMPREKTITRRKIIVAMMKKECQRVRRKTSRSSSFRNHSRKSRR